MEVIGFRNLDGPNSTIAKCLESLGIDEIKSEPPGVIRLAVFGRDYSDEWIKKIADKTNDTQLLWGFSPNSRQIKHPRLKLTHVPAASDREFVLKIAGHIERFTREQPPGSALNPERPTFPDIHREYPSIEAIQPQPDTPHTFRTILNDVCYDMYCHFKSDSNQLVVMSQDALNRSSVSLPYFFRWQWAYEIQASVIILNDPTLYLASELNAGWWVGTRKRDYIRELVDIIRVVTSYLSIDHSDVLFFGASAGGFSAMHLASALPTSTALVDIPQTDLRTYSEARESTKAIRVALGFDSADEVPRGLLHRIDVIERFLFEQNIPQTTYFQNTLDATHVDLQMNHFRNRLPSTESHKIEFRHYKQWHLTKGGHFPLKRSVMTQEINTKLAAMKLHNKYP